MVILQRPEVGNIKFASRSKTHNYICVTCIFLSVRFLFCVTLLQTDGQLSDIFHTARIIFSTVSVFIAEVD